MGRSYESKHSRQRSWFSASSLLSIFTPVSPEHSPHDTTRTNSIDYVDDKRKLIRKPSFTSYLAQHKRQSSENSSVYGSRRSSEQFSIISDTYSPLNFFKNDEEEIDRIRLKNDLIKLAFDGEFSLPFDYKNVKHCKVLDVGCGPGSWCVDLATQYPQLDVVGIDIDNLFFDDLPSNCRLFVYNVLDGFSGFSEASFDVIHIRFMALSFTLTQYPFIVKECWKLLKPGGYIEILETDLTVHSAGPTTNKLNQQMLQMANSKGLSPRKQAESLQLLVPKEAVNKQLKYRSIPMGVWGGRIGVLGRDDMLNMLAKSLESFDQNIVSREMEQYKSFSNYYFFTAQKKPT